MERKCLASLEIIYDITTCLYKKFLYINDQL